jgi:hypothetical protein
MIPPRNAVPSRYVPVITWILIAIDCLLFLFQDSLTPDELELFLRQFALIPARIPRPFHRGNRPRRRGYPALLLHNDSAWRVAPSDLEHVDAAVVRSHSAFSRTRNERFGEGDVFRLSNGSSRRA